MEQPASQENNKDTVTSEEDIRFTLEENQRLSRSLLWDIQQKFFAQQGIKAWREGVVPHYITSNTFIADSYAKVVFGFMRDCRAVAEGAAEPAFAPLNPDEPVYIVELGCGHGRFAYHFLKKFHTLHRQSVLRDVPYRYIMTDSTEANVEFWHTHESLQPFLDEDILDIAMFDPQHESELKLVHSGRNLSAGTVHNPMVFIANYFFDSIPMDVFYIKDGILYENLVSVTSSQEEPDPTNPEILSRMAVTYKHVQIDTDYYDEPEWNPILQRYRQRLADTAFLFPTGPLECIRNLQQLSGGRMMIISADQGDCREDELQGRQEINIALHGSFSLRVNYHAISQYVLKQQGLTLLPGHHPASLNISAFLFGSPAGNYSETRQAYEQSIEMAGPDDFYTFRKCFQESCENISIEQLLAFLRYSGWDANIFIIYFSTLIKRLGDVGDTQKREIYAAIRQAWSNYYHLGESLDVPFHLGTLLCQMCYYREALEFFGHSLRLYGQSPGTECNMAVCYEGLRDMDKARACVQRALELEPDFEPARALLIKLDQ